MSRTRKDSYQGTLVEAITRLDDRFDLFLRRKLECEGIDERGLKDVLCRRFGYCQDELDAILDELNRNGMWTVTLS